MYITHVFLTNIKCHRDFSMDFRHREAGWHVILGDNGAGKTSAIRAIAYGLIGPSHAGALHVNVQDWVRNGDDQWSIRLIVDKASVDKTMKDVPNIEGADRGVVISIDYTGVTTMTNAPDNDSLRVAPWLSLEETGWYSSGFGSFRRLFDGDQELQRVYESDPKAAAHLSLFREGAALRSSLSWLRELHARKLANPLGEEAKLLEWFIDFINRSNLLSKGVRIVDVNLDAVTFVDGNGQNVAANRLSDGFNSMLSLTFEMMRRLLQCYGSAVVMQHWDSEKCTINLPGVVLIDEVDAHLHPTWQTRIGNWFTTHFPAMQFIVTTHSPLICRGAAKGTIWKLPEPGTEGSLREILNGEKDKLVYGNILDAYETAEFGNGVSRGEEGKEKQKRYRELMMKRRFEVAMTPEEQQEFSQLQTIFQSHVED